MLREPDVYNYFKLKQIIESRPSDCLAAYEDGSKRPVFLFSHGGKERFVVEADDGTFHDADTLPGKKWIRWELKPEELALRQEEEKRRAEAAAKPKTFRELQQQAQESARAWMNQRYQQNRAVQGIEASDSALAQANQTFRNNVAARLKPQR